MQRGLSTEVLLALLDAPDGGIEGTELQALLSRHGRSARSDHLLTALLRLEGTDHVLVARGDRYRFALTDAGRERAIELGGGRPVHVRLLMADLVDFTAFTAAHGDAAAHDAARALASSARAVLRDVGGEVVKELGDGVLAWLPPERDALPIAREVAGRCHRPDGQVWSLRAASHLGQPIRSRGDLFGADVNLVARLCELADPGQMVTTIEAVVHDDPHAEQVDVRGVDAPVAIRRAALR